jgi:hypothetical protein
MPLFLPVSKQYGLERSLNRRAFLRHHFGQWGDRIYISGHGDAIVAIFSLYGLLRLDNYPQYPQNT